MAVRGGGGRVRRWRRWAALLAPVAVVGALALVTHRYDPYERAAGEGRAILRDIGLEPIGVEHEGTRCPKLLYRCDSPTAAVDALVPGAPTGPPWGAVPLARARELCGRIRAAMEARWGETWVSSPFGPDHPEAAAWAVDPRSCRWRARLGDGGHALVFLDGWTVTAVVDGEDLPWMRTRSSDGCLDLPYEPPPDLVC